MTDTSENSSGNRDRAQSGRVTGESWCSPRTVSLGKLTLSFFFFSGTVETVVLDREATALVGGKGLSFLAGPPRTALGGPPILS